MSEAALAKIQKDVSALDPWKDPILGLFLCVNYSFSAQS